MGGSNPSFQIPGAVQVGGVFGGGTAANFASNGVGTASYAALEWYNVGSPTSVNYEKGVLDWSGNVSRISMQYGGTGSFRQTSFVATPNGNAGSQTVFSVNPTILQTGTAGYTALDVNPAETSVGSGTKLLQRWAVGGTQVASIDNGGLLNLGAGSAGSTLDVRGSAATAISSTAVDVTLGITNFTRLIDATAAARIITLPTAASAARRIYVIKKIDASVNTVTIDGAGTETIDGALVQVLATQWSSLMIQSDGTAWYILAKN